MRVLVFIPVFNDFECIKAIQNQIYLLLSDYNVEILVVDDASTDEPFGILERTTFLRLPYNSGIGVITKIAVDYMVNCGFNVLARIDADGQHNVSDLVRVVNAIDTEVNIAISTRKNVTVDQNIALSVGRNIIRMLAKYSKAAVLDDYNSGLFACDLHVARLIRSLPLSFYCEAEIYVSMMTNKTVRYSIIDIDQSERDYGVSKIGYYGKFVSFVRFVFFILRKFTVR